MPGCNQVAVELVIDADGHVLEPPDVWERYLEPAYRARAIRVRRGGDGRDFLEIDGRPARLTTPEMLGGLGGMGETLEALTAACLAGRYAESAPPAATDPAARLRLLDHDGIARALLYPSLGLQWEAEAPDPGYALAHTRAYNRWIEEFCAGSGGRLVPIAHLSLGDPEDAARELRRAVRAGARGGFLLPFTLSGVPHGHPVHDPLWAVAEELDVPIATSAPSRPSSSASATIAFSGPPTTRTATTVRATWRSCASWGSGCRPRAGGGSSARTRRGSTASSPTRDPVSGRRESRVGVLAPRRRAEEPALALGIAIPPRRGARAAVHGERDAGHVAGQVRGEEDGGAGDVLGHAGAPERHEEAMARALGLAEHLREPFRETDIGRDRVDADRVRRQLERHRLREADDRRLARGVERVAGRRPLALDRHDVDDAPAASPRDHARRDRARAVQHRLQVGAHEGVPALLAGLQEGGAKRPAHVVDQHVDAAEALDGGGHGALDRLPVAHVGGQCEGLPARPLDLRGGGARRRRVELEDGDPGAERGETEGDPLPDARPGAGDDGGAPAEGRLLCVHRATSGCSGRARARRS